MRKKKDEQNQINKREAQYSNFLFSALSMPFMGI